MSNFLIDAPRLTVDDLNEEFGEDAEEEQLLEDFELAWIQYLRQNPEKLRGRQEKRINKIRAQMDETSKAQKKVEEELRLQLDFFNESRDQLEENFKKTMTAETENQKELREELDRDMDTAAIADHNFSLTLPWEKFFYNLDRLVAKENIDAIPADLITESGKQVLVPSKKAVLLLNGENKTDPDMNFMLHAYKMDEALMKAQIHMYKLEIERYEKTFKNLEDTGKFFHEHNIWGILSKGDDSTASKSKNSRSTVTTKVGK
eukprot:scaffold6200_cov118-Cylindrotheca_fusiformis.AAC.6